VKHANKTQFKGFFLESKPHGKGTEYKDNQITQATWVHGKKHGLAICTTGIGPEGVTHVQEWWAIHDAQLSKFYSIFIQGQRQVDSCNHVGAPPMEYITGQQTVHHVQNDIYCVLFRLCPHLPSLCCHPHLHIWLRHQRP